jgi:DNA-binding response OmpR family regulator
VQILLVEDEVSLADGLRRGLNADGFHVDVAHNGRVGLSMGRDGSYDMVILDLLLPGVNGFEVCRLLRDEGMTAPILILTAKTGEYDEVEALETGADDFLTKPFSYPVLVARVRALLRREAQGGRVVLVAGTLSLDPVTSACARDGTAIKLTARESGLLEYLMRHRDEVVTKEGALDRVWGADFAGDPNIVEVYVGYLRRKIDRPFGLDTIETVPGSGYRLVARDT